MTRRRHQGLTLLEATIVLAVIAVLGTLALPALNARADRARLQGAASLLAADIADARFEAARRGQPLHLEAAAGGTWCWAIATTPGCGCGQAQACELRHVSSADHPGVKLLDRLALRLDPGGAAQGRDAVVLESRRGERLRVEVTPLGRARVCAVAGTWAGLASC